MDKTENQLKYENYKEQFTRLKSALHSGFNLEDLIPIDRKNWYVPAWCI